VDIDGRHNGLSVGFNYSNNIRNPYFNLAVRSDETTFDINDVTIDFFCGWLRDPPYILTDGLDYSWLIGHAIYVANDQIFLQDWVYSCYDYRSIENLRFLEIISSEEYNSVAFEVTMSKRSGKIFNHCGERLTIPKELFEESHGTIWLWMQTIYFSPDENIYSLTIGGSMRIYYEFIDDNTVRLSK